MPIIVIQGEEGQLVVVSDPVGSGLPPGPLVIQTGNQPLDEKMYKFSAVVGFRVERAQPTLANPSILVGGL